MAKTVESIICGLKAKSSFGVVVKKIISVAISGIGIEVGTKQAAVDVSVIWNYNVNNSIVFDQIVEKVREAIAHMIGLYLVKFNMNANDVMTKEQYLEKYRGKDSDDNKGNI
ncbi:Asp23/Gls24 family envelope stress response protein [Enterococcus plantarum]|uniref:Asp23/Gls24 family envelope stress response protein n=1 Tax=Enterococcus plantarum TaxID=1077675 RepID=UPI001A8CA200|nr:Asp23/Gls24 family envelope stress response protein [Enterococcus plantarum]